MNESPELKRAASQSAIKRKRSVDSMDEASNDGMEMDNNNNNKNTKNAMQKTNSGSLKPPLSRNSSTSTSRTSSSSSVGDQMNEDEDEANKPVCMFGEKCYRKNPQHFQQFRHPWMNNKSSS